MKARMPGDVAAAVEVAAPLVRVEDLDPSVVAAWRQLRVERFGVWLQIRRRYLSNGRIRPGWIAAFCGAVARALGGGVRRMGAGEDEFGVVLVDPMP